MQQKPTQQSLVRAHLESGREIDWVMALHDYGIGGGFRMRISELRKQGMKIKKRMQPFLARITGNPGEYAVYYLEKE